MAGADDDDLLQRVRRGERAAFEAVARRHTPRLLRLARRLLGWNEPDAHDAVQDVLVKLLLHTKKAAAAKDLEAWLVTLTINACRTRGRRRLAWLRFLKRTRDVSPAPSAEASLIDAELSQRVRQAVRALPASDREVIVLHYFEGHDPAAIAAILNVRPNTIEVRLHRARKRLKELLHDVHATESFSPR